MSANMTVLPSRTAEMTPALFLSWELTYLISRMCFYVVYPCFGLIGILGNVTNIVILTRQGFRKCSNILLWSLAVSDCLFLIGINNVPGHIYTEYKGFRFSETLNFACFVLYILFICVSDIGLFASVIIPVLITGERILAIFVPFQANLILTPRRMVIVLSCLYLVDGILFTYNVILSDQLKNFLVNGVTVGVIVDSDMRIIHDRSGVKRLIDHISNYVTGVIPISLVTVGCVVIGLRIVQITNRRRKLTSKLAKASTKLGITKTTKTLLKICLLYTVCYGSSFIGVYVSQSKLLEQQLPTRMIIFPFQQIVLCLNCVGNFLIYLDSRNGFRKLIIVCRKIKTSR
ncbi:unnamed protein product [Candidula unifasciata]|uniref:G-protein coupled receptors family 1 profile domain-containing protein n=1 Tax=Candidula unifasciata TaxID=100452 RepID=A0A8S3ZMB9_9EUPU|nr:unnamed protein product [Candidula unifasciata]